MFLHLEHISLPSHFVYLSVCGLRSSGWKTVILPGSGVCPMLGEVDPGACAGFLVGGTSACPLVGGAGSCPSGRQGHVEGSV